ncbi:SEN1 N terminal-domain-containing protein [Lenzites betulinus]|nr:SEN1 N terminal-domain-containing protein [Lenzites betulinus]
MAPQPRNNSEVKKRLTDLRDAPQTIVGEEDLRLISTYLLGTLKKSNGSSDVPLVFDHWFCSQADEVTREAAIFLIRLHAYSSPSVDIWRVQLKRVITRCCYCVRGLHEAETMSRHTYFGAFTDQILQSFYGNFHKFLTDTAVESLAEKGFLSTGAPDPSRTLSDAPPAATFLILTYLHMLQDSRIVSLLNVFCPRSPVKVWPVDIPSPTLLALLFNSSPELRQWAQKQSTLCEIAPIPMENFLPSHSTVLKAAVDSIASSRPLGDCFGPDYKLSFVADIPYQWSGLTTLLRFTPVELFRSSKSFDSDIRRIVTGHLHDIGEHFIDVLKCFVIVLRRMGPDAWLEEGPEYAHVVFNSIKDNTRFSDVLCNLPAPVPKDDWQLKWIEVYANTVGKLPVFKDILPSILQFLCEELQHERFKTVRPNAMSIASRLLVAVLSQQGKDSSSRQNLALDLLTVHCNTFVSVAFGKTYADDAWMDARKQALRLIKLALVTDIRRLGSSVTSLSASGDADSGSTPNSLIREQIWKNVYDGITANDSEAISLLLGVLSQISHIDDLKAAAFEDAFKKSKSLGTSQASLLAVNNALALLRNGFRDVLARYTDINRASTAVELLGRDDVVRHVITLVFSPVEALQESAQGIVALAYDVDGRLDCLRALLEHFPEAAFTGLLDVLGAYNHYAKAIPEACSLSQALARCLTDVIEALSTSPSGLLLDRAYVKSAASTLEDKIPKWWHAMTEALCVIFAYTPRWARFFENEEMVLWMRDALIFGRDLLAQRKLLETAALARSQKGDASSARLTDVGKKMVGDLQQVLFELTKWLRLTDEELLHQSFALLETLLECFRQTETRPREETFQRIQRHIEDARKNDPTRMKSRLDSTRLLRLEEAVGSFDEDNDEIQIISHIKPSKPSKAPKAPKPAEVKKEARHILKASSTKDARTKDIDRKGITNYLSTGDDKKSTAGPSVPRFAPPAQSGRPFATAGSSKLSRPLIKDERASSKTSSSASRPVESPSSSENEQSDEEEDEGPKGLAALSKLQRTPVIKQPAERRGVKLLDMPLDRRGVRFDPVRRHAMNDAQRTALRLKPDVSYLHSTLLSWNYDHPGSEPPGDKKALLHVPAHFKDYDHFRAVFEPLLLLECWNQLMESKEAPQESYECKLTNRGYSDQWVDIEISFEGSVSRDWNLSETDIVLLQHPGSKRRVLGKAQSYRTSFAGISATIRFAIQGSDPGLQVGSIWSLSKVLSLSTLIREYAALMALKAYDVLDSVLHSRLARPPTVDQAEVQKVMSAYKVNEPQANAILKSLGTEGFALIQGPPGTGKTSTICGLVQLYLSKRPKISSVIHPGRPAERELPKKILLCAPSNAAIDEIAFRLKEVVSGAGHRAEHPKVVRIGAPKSMNMNVRDVSMEYLIDEKLNANPELKNTKEAGSDVARIRSEIDAVKARKEAKIKELEAIQDNASKSLELHNEITLLNKQRTHLVNELDRAKDKQKSNYRTLDATRRRFRNEVLQEADVICSTLSASAYEYLEPFDFELVIIDEAAQAIELSSLIPMKYRCRTCIMVGDPQQLPPTVKSQEACKHGYDQSLFVRLQKSQPDAVHLLSIQYRMHPDISQLPSSIFYGGRLQDGPGMAEKTKRPWHEHPKFGTYRFFNVQSGSEESSGVGHSLVNRTEIQVAVALYNRLIKDCVTVSLDCKIGVISMYRGQIVEMKRAFQRRFGEEVLSAVDFNTVDGFQGQEKDIIILSCVRAGTNLQSVGFLRDVRRMNVALTRAKASLFVLGHAPTLERSDDVWRNIVQNARSRSCLFDADVSYFTAPISATERKPPPPPKQVKPASKAAAIAPEATTPMNLVTPQEMKALANRPNGTPSSDVPSTSRKPSVGSSEPAASTSEDAHVGQKRKAEDTPKEDAAIAAGNAPPGQKPKPKPPLAKRPKQGPSLFIPKKRPAR